MKLMLHNYQATERRQSKVGILYLLSTYIGFIYIYMELRAHIATIAFRVQRFIFYFGPAFYARV